MKYYILDLKQRARVGNAYPNLKQAKKAIDRKIFDYGPPEPLRYCLDDDLNPVIFIQVK